MSTPTAGKPQHQLEHPNVVYVLTDDQGYGELGCHGNKDIQTPHIDELYRESIRFADFHVGTTCAPTRSGLLTGHYCNSAGVWHTIGGRSLLREDEWTLPQALEGYQTAHFGKWHLGDSHPFRPHERGFDHSVYHGGGGVGNTPDAWGNDYFDDTYFVNGVPQKFHGYCTDVFFNEAISFIEKSTESKQPFFVYLATNAPHGPFNVENNYADLYRDKTEDNDDRACFYGMVTNIDENIGKLRSELKRMKLDQSTILIFMSDNGSGGGVTCDHDGFVDEDLPCNFNAGMRGSKGWEYEGGHRVPFLMHLPDNIVGFQGNNQGRTISELTSYIDFMPTILDLCNIPIPPERSFHGTSLGPIIRGWEQPDLLHRTTVVDTQRVARPVKWHRSCVMRNKWRLINQMELYNLETDPGQRHNLLLSGGDDDDDEHNNNNTRYKKLIKSLRQSYEEWWELVSEQFDRDTPFVLTTNNNNNEGLTLSTHDIRNDAGDTAWHQVHVREGKAVSGYWALDVRVSGRYQIELRRWPASTKYPLTEGIQGDDSGWRKDCIAAKNARLYEGGVAIDLQWAHIEIAGQSLHQQIETRRKLEESVVFETTLPIGETKLFAGFYPRRPFGENLTIAPYYIYITPSPDQNEA